MPFGVQGMVFGKTRKGWIEKQLERTGCWTQIPWVAPLMVAVEPGVAASVAAAVVEAAAGPSPLAEPGTALAAEPVVEPAAERPTLVVGVDTRPA